ncbi:DNA polymerase thumb domain-containing protein, partial [Escherichia coli]|uniref:DNA polymerase thumb domain-containing protein n=1 Tax=Escherichia coli TaxID=562 RepID=UPI00404460BF
PPPPPSPRKPGLTCFTDCHLAASAGVGRVKFLAKIASEMNKPNGQFVITPAEVPAFLQTLPLAKIPGVGKVPAAKLEAMGLRTCGDVQKCDLVTRLTRFGQFGRFVWGRSQGVVARQGEMERVGGV